MLPRWLATTHERANDLRRTLARFEASDPASVVASFQTFSKQCELLHDRCDDATATTLLNQHFVMPAAISGMASIAGLPFLLSTRLAKEHEGQVASCAMLTHEDACTDSDRDAHNKTVVAAHAHLARSTEMLDLPGAVALRLRCGGGNGGTANAANAANATIAANATSMPAAGTPAPAAASQPQEILLVSALRTGVGLELPPPPMADEGLERMAKWPRTGTPAADEPPGSTG